MSEAAAFYEEAGITPGHGLIMYGFNVLVKPKAVEDKIGSIIIPDDHKDKLAYSVTEGELVAMSNAAFSYHDWPEGTRLPQIGDRVVYNKYVGGKAEGNDGVEYRVMEDKEILAVRS
jgi:co-chaperonin GroES (HSP10)